MKYGIGITIYIDWKDCMICTDQIGFYIGLLDKIKKKVFLKNGEKLEFYKGS